GSNVAQVAAPLADAEELEAYKEQGLIHPDFPIGVHGGHVLKFMPPNDETLKLPLAVASPYKTLKPYSYNMNYIGIIFSARSDMHDSLVIIKDHMGGYIAHVAGRFMGSMLEPAMFYQYFKYPD